MIALNPKRGLRHEREKPLIVKYRGVSIGEFRADLIVEEQIVVELKVVEHIAAMHESQLLNYLRAAGLSVGLILNFGPKAGTRRVGWNGKRVEFADLNNR